MYLDESVRNSVLLYLFGPLFIRFQLQPLNNFPLHYFTQHCSRLIYIWLFYFHSNWFVDTFLMCLHFFAQVVFNLIQNIHLKIQVKFFVKVAVTLIGLEVKGCVSFVELFLRLIEWIEKWIGLDSFEHFLVRVSKAHAVLILILAVIWLFWLISGLRLLLINVVSVLRIAQVIDYILRICMQAFPLLVRFQILLLQRSSQRMTTLIHRDIFHMLLFPWFFLLFYLLHFLFCFLFAFKVFLGALVVVILRYIIELPGRIRIRIWLRRMLIDRGMFVQKLFELFILLFLLNFQLFLSRLFMLVHLERLLHLTHFFFHFLQFFLAFLRQ